MEAMNPSYTALIKAFAEYLKTLGFADSTVYDYPLFIHTFLSYLEQKGITHIRHITTQTLFDYFYFLECKRGERTKQTFSTSHLNRQFGAVDKFMEFLHHTGVHNAPPPTHYLVERKRKKPLRVLTPEEVQSLYDTVPLTFPDLPFAHREPRQMAVRLVLDLCYGCGLRRAEALNVKISDVNFDTKILHVRQGKGYKDRYVPMSRKVYGNIRTFVYQYRRCFASRNTYLYPFKSGAIAETPELLIKYGSNETLKAKSPTLHTLRHSIATHLLQNGMDIENIARFLGHGTLESTKIYTHILNESSNGI